MIKVDGRRYVYSGKDILFDTHYIKDKMHDTNDCLFIEKGYHGSCLFGRRSNDTINIIKEFLKK